MEKKICMETRLCNIFKTGNAINLTKTILESPYKVGKKLFLINSTIFKAHSIIGYL